MIADDLERLAERGPHHNPDDVVASALAESDAAHATTSRRRAMAVAAASLLLIAGVVASLVARSGGDPGGIASSPTSVGEPYTLLALSSIVDGDELVATNLPDGWEIDDAELGDGIIRREFRDPARDAAGSVSVGFGNVDRVDPDGELRRLGGVDWYVTVQEDRSTTYTAVGDDVFLLVGGSVFDPAELDQFVAGLRAGRPASETDRPGDDDVVLDAASDPAVAVTNDTDPSTTASPVPALPADNITWERTTDIGSIARSQVTQAVAGPAGFVAVGMGFDDGRNQGRVWYSTDGHSWEEPALDLFDAKVIDTVAATSDAYFVVAYTNTDRLGLGEGANPADAQLFRSIDGRNWEPWGDPWGEAQVIGGVGGALLRSPSQSGSLEWSADGITWTAAEFPDSGVDGSYFNLRGGLAYTADAIYLTGSTTDPSDEFSFAVWSSDDNGRSWHQLTAPPGLGTIATVPDGVVMIINPSDPDCAAVTTSPDAQWTCTMRPAVYRYDTRTATWALNPNQPGETVSGLPVARLNNTLVVALIEPSKALTIWTAPVDSLEWSEQTSTRLAYADNTGSPGTAAIAASDNTVVVFTEDRLVDEQTAIIVGRSDAPSSNLSLLDAVRPSQQYFVAVWDAREVVIGECMNQQGFDYRPRPNDAAATGGTWDDWNQWKNEQTASHPSFESALQGRPDAQAGGCQLEAYRAVHGPGEEAYSKAATLENELRAHAGGLDLDQTTVDQWVAEHAEEVDRVNAELDEELQTARRIIQNSTP